MKFRFSLLIFIILQLTISCDALRNDEVPQISNVPAANAINAPTNDFYLDSLLQMAATAPQDTNLIQLYFDIGAEYYRHHNDFENAKNYYFKANRLSEELNWSQGRFLFVSRYTNILNKEGLADSAIVINLQALELAKNERNEKWITNVTMNLGVCYYIKNWYETSLKYYHEVLPLVEKQDNRYKLAQLYDLMGILYGSLSMYDENLEYAEKAMAIWNEKPDTLQRANALINYAVLLIDLKKFDRAENALMEAQRIANLHNNKSNLIKTYGNLGFIALKKMDLNKADAYYKKELEMLGGGYVESHCLAHLNLSCIELYKGNFKKSEEYVNEALKTALEYEFLEIERECYKNLMQLAITQHDFRRCELYTEKTDSIDKLLTYKETRKNAQEMEAKYETENKELKIKELENEKRLMTELSIAVGVALLLALTAFFFLWRWTAQRKKFAEAHVKQLEQEKQLVATQAVLDGETRERTRLARDLHDGLGGMLTGVRLNLQEMKDGVKLEYADVERFDKALGLLDESVKEMRRVSHHLMPDSLSRFGLKAAVKDFCHSISQNITFNYYGEEIRLDPQLEVMIYRTIHELVNNALKHAGAAQIMVQILQESGRIAFTVEDNGCGFNTNAPTKGSGLQNIKTRIEAYNGTLHIDSKLGVGTEVSGELRVEL